MDYRNKVIIACASYIIIRKRLEKRRRKPRWWMTTLFRNRQLYSGDRLLLDLQAEESGKFSNFCRMSVEDFEKLLHAVERKIMKQDTNFRNAISARERLAITLRFLGTGDSYTSLMYLFKVSKQTISRIIPEVCEAVIEVLRENIQVS